MDPGESARKILARCPAAGRDLLRLRKITPFLRDDFFTGEYISDGSCWVFYAGPCLGPVPSGEFPTTGRGATPVGSGSPLREFFPVPGEIMAAEGPRALVRMPYFPGSSLPEYLANRGPVAEEEILWLLEQGSRCLAREPLSLFPSCLVVTAEGKVCCYGRGGLTLLPGKGEEVFFPSGEVAAGFPAAAGERDRVYHLGRLACYVAEGAPPPGGAAGK